MANKKKILRFNLSAGVANLERLVVSHECMHIPEKKFKNTFFLKKESDVTASVWTWALHWHGVCRVPHCHGMVELTRGGRGGDTFQLSCLFLLLYHVIKLCVGTRKMRDGVASICSRSKKMLFDWQLAVELGVVSTDLRFFMIPKPHFMFWSFKMEKCVLQRNPLWCLMRKNVSDFSLGSRSSKFDDGHVWTSICFFFRFPFQVIVHGPRETLLVFPPREIHQQINKSIYFKASLENGPLPVLAPKHVFSASHENVV